MSTNILKTCPFCGGDVELRDRFDKDETTFIHCTNCHMWFEKFVWRAYDKKDIIEEWNTRKVRIDDVLRDIECLIADMPYDMSDQEKWGEISRNRNRLLEGLRKGIDIERIYRQIKGRE